MLFADKIILLDFLDSFIETPLIDLTKLMQEVNLKWSLLINLDKYDYTKIGIGYEYLKGKFVNKMEEFVQYNKIQQSTLDAFYKLTLIRILPYCKSEHVYNAVYRELLK
jgi:hypothetical protein